MTSELDGRHTGQDFLCDILDKPTVDPGREFAIQPRLIFLGDIYRTIENSGPFQMRCVVVRMRDDNSSEAA